MATQKIGIAILGAGIFAREQHLPAIQACSSLELKAIYSRSQKSASALASNASSSSSSTIDVYSDDSSADCNLDALLSRPDIQAVIIALPITSQPAIIKRALSAGKHVLSEKPIAPTVEAARELLAHYDSLPTSSRGLWSIAENFRFEPHLVRAAELVQSSVGPVTSFSLTMLTSVEQDNKWLNTSWRAEPTHPGGFVLDGGVHSAAGLRLILGKEIEKVSARTRIVREYLGGVDTVHAVCATSDGVDGAFTMSFASAYERNEILVVGGKGAVLVEGKIVTLLSPTGEIVSRDSYESEPAPGQKKIGSEPGVEAVGAEVKEFAEAILRGSIDEERSGVRTAVRDLALIEGLLKSGEKGGEVAVLDNEV